MIRLASQDWRLPVPVKKDFCPHSPKKALQNFSVFFIIDQLAYGINISAIVTSIVHKITYTVEDVTGIGVAAVNVFVEGMQVS